MSEAGNVNKVRQGVLDRIERSERHTKLAFFVAGVIEAAFLLGFLLLADLHNRTHVLMFLSTIAIYTILALGLVALATHVSRNTLRILSAIELLEKDNT